MGTTPPNSGAGWQLPNIEGEQTKLGGIPEQCIADLLGVLRPASEAEKMDPTEYRKTLDDTKVVLENIARMVDNEVQRLPLAERANQISTWSSNLSNKIADISKKRAVMDQFQRVRSEVLFQQHTTYIGQKMAQTVKNLTGKEVPLPFQKAMDDFFFAADGTGSGGIARKVTATMHAFEKMLEAPLAREGMADAWRTPEVFDTGLRLFFGEKVEAVPEAQNLSDIFSKFQEYAFTSLNRAGLPVNNTKKLLFNDRIADPSRVRRFTEDEFVDIMRTLKLDRDIYFGLSDEEIEASWRSRYQKIISYDTDKSGIAELDVGSVKERFADVARRGALDDAIAFADADSLLRFHEEFGDGNLQGALMRRATQLGRQVGILNTLGAQPEKALLRLMENFENRMTADEKAFFLNKPVKFERDVDPTTPSEIFKAGAKELAEGATTLTKAGLGLVKQHPLNVLAELTGETASPVNIGLAKSLSSFRAFVGMVKLPLGVFSQTMDLVTKAAYFGRVFQTNPVEEFFEAVSGFFGGKKSPQMKAFLQEIIRDHEMGQMVFASNLAGSGNYDGGVLNRGINMYYKGNLMGVFDRMQKEHSAYRVSSKIAESLKEWKVGDEDTPILSELRRYGITDSDFDTLRNHLFTLPEGTPLVDLTALREFSPRYPEFLAALEDLVETATPTPGVREKAIINRGTRPGTTEGELFRTLGQFKSFPLTTVNRTLPAIFPEMTDGNRLTAQTLIGLSGLVGALMFQWYISDTAKQWSQGKTARPLDDPNTFWLALVRSGAGGIYGDILTADYHRHGLSLADVVGGPAIGYASDFATLAAAARAEAGNALEVAAGKDPDKALTPGLVRQKMSSLTPDIPIAHGIFERFILSAIMRPFDPEWDQRIDESLEKTGQERLF